MYDLTGLLIPFCCLIGVIFTSDALPFLSAAILPFCPLSVFGFELFDSDLVAPTNFYLAAPLELPGPSVCFFAAAEAIGFLVFVGDVDILPLFLWSAAFLAFS